MDIIRNIETPGAEGCTTLVRQGSGDEQTTILDGNGHDGKNDDRIHATVRGTLIYKFEDEIKEGEVYTLSNFGIAANVGEYRTTRHQFKFNFQYATKVKHAEGNSVSPLLYAIPHPSAILSTQNGHSFGYGVFLIHCYIVDTEFPSAGLIFVAY
ncbi:replication factor A protein [Trifolium repens]|nr:replication factor A protein [Trifolium repens]